MFGRLGVGQSVSGPLGPRFVLPARSGPLLARPPAWHPWAPTIARQGSRLLSARAQRILTARETGGPLPRDPELDLAVAYKVAAEVEATLQRTGHTRMGRKIGFTNQATWAAHNLDQPIWAPIYRSTVTDNPIIALDGIPEPRLEPEIVVCLAADVSGRPAPADIAWCALGVEIVASHHPGWQFSPAEAVADLGVHSLLVIGPKLDTDPNALHELKVAMTGPLTEADPLTTTGCGADVLGGPLEAIAALATLPGAAPLRAGEVITTGTLVNPPFIKPKEQWAIAIEGGPTFDITT